MKKIKDEKILVVARQGKITENLAQGCFDLSKETLEEILSDAVYGTRYLMEENKNYKQLIPYVAIINNGKVFIYQRGSAGGENKLHAQYSLGVGGHIDMENDNAKSSYDTLIDSCLRELEEEVGLTIEKESLQIQAYINDDSDENNGVGKIHYGLCFVIYTDINMGDGEIEYLENRSFMSADEISTIHSSLEEWSKLFYDKIIKDLIQ